MKYYQQSKKYLNRQAKALHRHTEKDSIKKIKRLIIIVFGVLLVLDVIFVMPSNEFPTISRVVQFSSPKSLYLLFIWGVATANLFFPRKMTNPAKIKVIGFFSLILITVPLIFWGLKISKEADGLTCADATSIPTTVYTEIICYTRYDDDKKPDDKVDCQAPARACSYIRMDITTASKATLIIAGMLFGYFLWPQLEREQENPNTNLARSNL